MKKQWLVLGFILLTAALMRLYHIDQYMTFLGDEGRDVLIVRNLLLDRNIPFIGPPTSVGNVYLGPLYYYMMAVAMAIAWLNPVAPAVMVALIGTGAVFLIYYLGKLLFDWKAGLTAAALYSVSFVVINYSRSSWNPNPAPFFTLLAMIGWVWAHQKKQYRYLLLSGAAVSAAVQMHYLCLILLLIFGCLAWLEMRLQTSVQKIKFITAGIGGVVVFLAGMLPWWLFEFKHNFMNSRAMMDIFFGGNGAVSANPLSLLVRPGPIYFDALISRYLAAENVWLAAVVAVVVIATLIWGWNRSWSYKLLTIWLAVGLIGLALYQQNIYDHYIGFLSPVPFLVLGSLVSLSLSKQKKIAVLILLSVIVILNLLHSPLLLPPNRQLERTQQVSKRIIELAAGQPFNFALLSDHNYDAAYQYYLWYFGYQPKVVPIEITDQLIVVCENSCEPINNPKYEIVAFGWVKVGYSEDYMGVKIIKLVHNNVR